LVDTITAQENSPLSDEHFVTTLYRRVLQRDPNPFESSKAMEFLKQSQEASKTPENAGGGLSPRAQLAQVLLIGNEATYID
ncbi:MAG: DUF4214 domain-containing protein, partial [Pirellula sp.]